MFTVIVPASNEASLIGQCVGTLLASSFATPTSWELIVVANGCTDETAAIARSHSAAARASNVELCVLDLEQGNKLNAINVGEAHARYGTLVYIDADVLVSPTLLDELARTLQSEQPTYATGTLQIADARSWVTRAYSRFWSRLPFVVDGVAGCGVFAVNRQGRLRWGPFPQIISDDTFVRLHFAPSERISVSASFTWPMVEGFSNLVRVRRRQDQGVSEIAQKYPNLMHNEQKSQAHLGSLFARDPIGFVVYSLVAIFTKLPTGKKQSWVRGR